MKPNSFLSAILLVVLLLSCGRQDNGVEPINISLTPDMYDATFYEAGETEAVFVVSDLGEPQLSVSPDTNPAISYNPATNKVEWTKLLPLGEHIVTVLAVVEATETTTDLIIRNSLDALFKGGYNFDATSPQATSFFNYVQFRKDNTLILEDEGESPGVGYPGSGTWSVADDTIEFTYSYDINPAIFYTFRGTLTYNDTEAYISGLWYNGSQATEGMERGYFRIALQ